ncbi:hypothetical protein Q7P37_002827 [Cladosporium fusiforme]
MGLAGQKRRNKIGADPNNTNWAKSETNYGARLLAKSGWQPGQFLGAENANHSEHYTAANASHIRVVLREDNAGLGAIKGKSNADTFGLSTLSGIFGRLNGKSEVEVQKQADTQRDLELQAYQSHKWGTMNFVYGGLLVGDKMEEKKKLEEATAKAAQSKRKAEDDVAAAPSSAKKRKHTSGEKSAAASDSSDDSEDEDEEDATEKKQKKEKKRSKKEESAAESTSDVAEKASKKERKEKRKKDKKSGDSDEKAHAKEEKRARKEERRKRKEEKRRRKEAKGKTSTQTSRDQSSDSSSDEDSQKPAESKPAAASFGGSRHAVRQRYIMQKRQAGMNPQAMAEILMLKASA